MNGGARDADGRADLLRYLQSRYSVGPKQLAEPGPGDDELLAAARTALRAPDHKHLVPFRFALVDPGRRGELARLFEAAARRAGDPPDAVAAEGRRAYNGPVLVALVARIDASNPQVPAHEQWICVGGALANFLNALHLMGYGAKMLSGRKTSDPDVHAAFCGPGETLVGWMAVGTPVTQSRARVDDDPRAVLGRWSPPSGD